MTVVLVALAILIVAFAIFSLGFYFTQEKYLFGPKKLAADHSFSFDDPFEERFITMKDGTRLNGLLFRTEDPKGVILYLHGSKNALDFWGYTASLYTKLGYDIFYFDYRGFGKSEGAIKSLEQLYGDVQTVYDEIKAKYGEDKITLIGFSLGTGLAAYLA